MGFEPFLLIDEVGFVYLFGNGSSPYEVIYYPPIMIDRDQVIFIEQYL